MLEESLSEFPEDRNDVGEADVVSQMRAVCPFAAEGGSWPVEPSSTKTRGQNVASSYHYGNSDGGYYYSNDNATSR